MTTREEALAFGLSYPDTCQDAPVSMILNWHGSCGLRAAKKFSCGLMRKMAI